MATLQCLGATGTVTGSKHLVQAAGHRVLVDWGLYRGLEALRLCNWKQLPVEPVSVDWVVLTHANAMERFVL
jgi:metallo-beta-lactamase family protein